MFNASDPFQTKQLFDAVKNNDLEKVKFFIEEQNAPTTIINDLRRTLAHAAARKGNLEVIRYLAQKQPSLLPKTDKYDFSVLGLAVKNGAIEVVKYLVENHEADLTKRNDRDLKSVAMHTAIKYGRLDILKYFVEERNYDLNTPGEWEEQPPIFTAVKYQQKDIINYLVNEKNVDLEKLNFRNENILYVIVGTNDLPYMKYLLEQKGVPFDMNWRNNYGETLVFRATTWNRTDILKYLVGERFADVNMESYWDKYTPLHCAAIQNHFENCQYLIEHEAKPDLKDYDGEIPAQKATDVELREYLRKCANVSSLPNPKKKIQRGLKRYRRRIDSTFQPGVMLYERAQPEITEQTARIRNHRLDDNATISTPDTLRLHLSQFQHFITIVELIITGGRAKRSGFFSPWNILQSKMDPIAVDAIMGIPKFRIS